MYCIIVLNSQPFFKVHGVCIFYYILLLVSILTFISLFFQDSGRLRYGDLYKELENKKKKKADTADEALVGAEDSEAEEA